MSRLRRPRVRRQVNLSGRPRRRHAPERERGTKDAWLFRERMDWRGRKKGHEMRGQLLPLIRRHQEERKKQSVAHRELRGAPQSPGRPLQGSPGASETRVWNRGACASDLGPREARPELLPLRELEALASALAAVFLAFLHAAVAGEIAGVAQLLGHAAVGRRRFALDRLPCFQAEHAA